MNKQLIGIDTGGTFTDLVLIDTQGLRVHKVLSTPQAPEQAILQGLDELGLNDSTLPHNDIQIVHGSTVATNAVLEAKGVATLLITNRGFADLLSIGRQARAQLYALQPPLTSPPVPPEYCLEIDARSDAQGQPLNALSEQDLKAIDQAIDRLKPEAIAVNLLFSWLDDQAEQQIASHIRQRAWRQRQPAPFISLSSEVLPEIKEVERGMATWINAWVGPLMRGYIERLQKGIQQRLPQARLHIMQSNGDLSRADKAANHAVRLLLSGPAGGLLGAAYMGAQSQQQQLLSFDMGGTSTDVALIDGDIALSSEGQIGGHPIAVPMIDMHTIGAGGGSIAWLDQGGALQVGPQSAGATPGPACYGQGGQQATVTDANLILGRLPAQTQLGGHLKLDLQAAENAIDVLGQRIGRDRQATAEGIIELANEHMAQALHVMTVQRGIDPRPYTLVSFGGAGGLHVCDLAERIGCTRALIPANAGVLSAFGLLTAAPGRYLTRSLQPTLTLQTLGEQQKQALQQQYEALQHQAEQALLDEGSDAQQLQHQRHAELRYQGQSYTLSTPWLDDANEVCKQFEQQHRQRYGHDLSDNNKPIEIVTIKVHISGQRQQTQQLAQALLKQSASTAQTNSTLQASQNATHPNGQAPIIDKQQLRPGERIQGPCIISEAVATSYIANGWIAQADPNGNLQLSRRQAPEPP